MLCVLATVQNPMAGGFAAGLAMILSLLAGIAGWHYLFYSRSAQRLAAIEGTQLNARRVLLRRANGGLMLMLSMAMVIGFWGIDWRPSVRFLGIWATIFLLILGILVLVLLDIRLTRSMHARDTGHRGG